jgi:hypothetical protein
MMCITCPTGANCSHQNGITLHQIVARSGFWRPNSTTDIFADCRKGYRGSEAAEKARARCCPPGKCRPEALLNGNNTMFDDPNEQCLEGFSGALCLVCAEDYVALRGSCEPCPGGAMFANAAIATASVCVFVAFVVLVVLLCAPSEKRQNELEGTWSYFGQLKIILSFVQILAAIPGVYDHVPWVRYDSVFVLFAPSSDV